MPKVRHEAEGARREAREARLLRKAARRVAKKQNQSEKEKP